MIIKVKHLHWNHTCGDGCCYDWGVKSTFTLEDGAEIEINGSGEDENCKNFFAQYFDVSLGEDYEHDYED